MPPKKSAEAAAPPSAARFGRVKNNLRMGLVGVRWPRLHSHSIDVVA